MGPIRRELLDVSHNMFGQYSTECRFGDETQGQVGRRHDAILQTSCERCYKNYENKNKNCL